MVTCILSTGYEPHQLLWHHPWSSVCLIHCTVLWISAGSSGVGLTKSQWNGRTPTDAKWLLNLPGCADRNPTSHQIVLKIHWQNARLLQVAFFWLLFSFIKVEREHNQRLIFIKLFRCYSTKSRLYSFQVTHNYDAELFALIDQTCILLGLLFALVVYWKLLLN